MGSNLRREPEAMRGRADESYSVAPGVRVRGKDDPTWESSLYEGAGYGVHAYALVARKKREARTAGWSSVADGLEGAGDTGYAGAIRLEDADVDGGADVDRVSRRLEPQ